MKLNAPWTRLEFIFITLLGVSFTALFAIYLGQDMNPDLINYHFYSGYLSFHTERLTTDVIPSNIQGYLNPYIYSLYFLLYKIVSPEWVGAIIGGIHGVNFVCIYLIARLSLSHWPLQQAKFAAFLCAVFGLLNPFFLAMVGASWSDNLTPILILPALAIILYYKFKPESTHQNVGGAIGKPHLMLALAGLLLGLSVGFKLTNVAFVIGLIPAWLMSINFKNRLLVKESIKELIITLTGVTIGFLIVNGAWMWGLWSHFQNPMFPFYNGVFKSQQIVEIWTNIPAWAAAHSLLDYLIYPFNWVMGIPPKTEWDFRDPRFAVIYILIFLRIAHHFLRTYKFSIFTSAPIENNTPNYIVSRWKFMFIWGVISYLFWLNQFGALRYLIPVTFLTGLAILLLLDGFIAQKKTLLAGFSIIAIICLAMIQQPPYGRLPWSQSWYPVTLPDLIAKEPALYFNRDSSLILPFFPKDSRFFGFVYLDSPDGLTQFVRNEIHHSPMPMRTLTAARWSTRDDDQLAMLSLRRNPFDCLTFSVDWIKYETCKVEKITTETIPVQMPNVFQIDLNKPHLTGVSNVDGFSSAEPLGSWTEGPAANIKLAGNLPANFDLTLTAYAFAKNAEVGIDVIIGDQKRRVMLGNTMTSVVLPYTFKSDIAAGSSIRFEIPFPTSPSEIDSKSADSRKLGTFIQSLHIGPSIPIWPMEIDVSHLSGKTYLKEFSGFSTQEPTGRWTEGVTSSLVFEKPLPKHFKLSLRASALPVNTDQLATVLIGRSKYKFKLSNVPSDYEFEVQTDSSSLDKVEFNVPFATSPKEIGLSTDSRILGMFLENIKITPFWPMTIDFSRLSSGAYLKDFSGFSIQESSGRWTEGTSSSLVFEHPLPKRFKLSLRASALPSNADQWATISVGKSKYKFKLSSVSKDYIFNMRTDSSSVTKIEFSAPFATSPKAIGLSTDSRILGMFLEKVTITK